MLYPDNSERTIIKADPNWFVAWPWREALDLACAQGSDEEVEATGSQLIKLWEMFR
jgi:hypothetical protein